MTLARNEQDQERLIALVREALAQLDAGQAVDARALCGEHPHLAAPLAEVLGLQDQLPLLQQVALRDDPLAGAVLAGRYRLATCLGRGAMGVVYEGEDQELRRPVAVKILDVRLFRDPDAERRFQREAESLAALQHRHVVAVFDRGRTPEGIHYLVMERLQGGTFARLLDRVDEGASPLAAAAEVAGASPQDQVWPRLVARWGHDLARGLAAAHDRGLVHRDVKPSNIFLAGVERAVLLDFGIAARLTEDRLTATATTLGTPWYMAPEQVRAGGVGAAAPAVDVYGLGASLFHLLAGRSPYEGEAAAVLAALPVRDPPLLHRLRPELPRDLAAIVDRCLERAPARRYPTANAMADDLAAFLEHRPVSARPLGFVGRRLRAFRRAPARSLAVLSLVFAVAAVAVLVPYVAHQRLLERLHQKAELLATLPSVLAVEGWPHERVLEKLAAEHRTGIELLDQILALDPDDAAMRLFRACLHLDLGDRGASAADFAELARRSDSDYVRAVAARYAQADSTRGAAAIDLVGLPAPAHPLEFYVAGFHELRRSDQPGFAGRADALLAKAADSYLPARDQRLLSRAALAERSKPEEQPALVQALYQETFALEAEYGRQTARTCALRGVALLMQRNYRDCIEHFERSLELRPGRHGPHHNLGVAFLRLQDLDRAERHLKEALRLRSFAWNTQFMLAQLHQERGEYAAARERVQALASAEQRGEGWKWKEPGLLGNIELAAATALHRTDRPAAIAAAERAVVAYDEALAARKTAEVRQWRAVAVALQEDRPQAVVVSFAQALLVDPDNHFQLANLAFLMPNTGLDATETAWVAAVLRKLAWQRAAGNQAFRARMEAEIDEVLKGHR